MSLGIYRSQGFTLLEILVAFVILAISLTVIFQLFGQSFRAADLSRQYNQASVLSQSLLARVGTEIPLQTGTHQGEADQGYHWQIKIRPYEVVLEDDAILTPYLVSVQLSWGESGERQSREIILNSIRLGEMGE